MANFRLDESVLKGVLDDLFNASDILQYVLAIANSVGAISGGSENCSFKNAVYDSVNKLAYVELDTPVYFVVSSGTTIDRLNLSGNIDPTGVKVYMTNEGVTSKTYGANGTYTVSNLIFKLGE